MPLDATADKPEHEQRVDRLAEGCNKQVELSLDGPRRADEGAVAHEAAVRPIPPLLNRDACEYGEAHRAHSCASCRV